MFEGIKNKKEKLEIISLARCCLSMESLLKGYFISNGRPETH
jgi:hypothetical protein